MTLLEMYNQISEDIEILRDRNLTEEKLKLEIDRSMALSRSRELQMSQIAMMVKTADTLLTLDPDLKLDLSSIFFPESYKQADTKPLLANGRKQLVDTSKGRRNE